MTSPKNRLPVINKVLATPGCTCGKTDCGIPWGYCHCLCGNKTTVPIYTNRSVNRYGGKPVAYLTGHNGIKRIFPEEAKPFKIDGEYCRLMKLMCGTQYTIVSESDYLWLSQWTWYARKRDSRGYSVCRRIRGWTKAMVMHDFILKPRKGKTVDHRDRNSFDNRRTNLRRATPAQQVFNRGKNKENTYPYKGIRKTPSGRWSASIKFNYVGRYLGIFDTAEEAAMAYDRAAVRLFGEFAYLNFPDRLSSYRAHSQKRPLTKRRH